MVRRLRRIERSLMATVREFPSSLADGITCLAEERPWAAGREILDLGTTLVDCSTVEADWAAECMSVAEGEQLLG